MMVPALPVQHRAVPLRAANANAAGAGSSGFDYLKKQPNMTEEDLENGEESLSEKELFECELIRRLIISYFHIVRESIQDQVPKAVMHLLVNFSKESTENRLVSKLLQGVHVQRAPLRR